MTLEEANNLIYDEKEGLGLCGCGMPRETFHFIYLILLLQHRYKSDEITYEYRERFFKKLLPTTPVYWYVLYSLNSRGFFEHGGNAGGSWLTEKGKDFLSICQTWGWRTVYNPDFAIAMTESYNEETALGLVNHTISFDDL